MNCVDVEKIFPESGTSANVLSRMKPRIDTKEVSRVSGLKPRTVTALAAQKKIPGAIMLGSVWRFDPDQVLLWITGETCQNETLEKTSTSNQVANTSTSGFASTASKNASLFEQLIGAAPKK